MNGSVAGIEPTTAVTAYAQEIGGAQRVIMVDAYRGAPIASLHVDVALSLGAELVLCAQRAKRRSDLDRILFEMASEPEDTRCRALVRTAGTMSAPASTTELQRIIDEAYESGWSDALKEAIWVLQTTRDRRAALARLQALVEPKDPGGHR